MNRPFGRRTAAPRLQPLPLAAQRGSGSAAVSGPAAHMSLDRARERLRPDVARTFDPLEAGRRPRGEMAASLGALITRTIEADGARLQPADHRILVTEFLNGLVGAARLAAAPPAQASPRRPPRAAERAMALVLPVVLDRIDSAAASAMSRGELGRRLREMLPAVLAATGTALNASEQRDLVGLLIDDLLGLGPLEPLLADDGITDIMANGPDRIWVERQGRLQETEQQFRDSLHMMAVISRMVTAVGRRIDESSPLVDARLLDGSRVNIIIPPLAIDGPAISIRKFRRQGLDLDRMAAAGSLSPEMATLLKVAARVRLNILVSGGTGSGKTTMLNALSRLISAEERIVTIEDAAELQLQQPHVVRLETRPASLEGRGEIGMRELVRNALRMRPDRIIVGEIRGAEAVDMLQAMTTGHDGSLGTIHANRPRESLMRLENMVAMAGLGLPLAAIRTQIGAAVHLIVQVARMRDGVRRVIGIAEVTGMEGDIIAMHDLFAFKEASGGGEQVKGRFEASGIVPLFAARAAREGLDDLLRQAVRVP